MINNYILIIAVSVGGRVCAHVYLPDPSSEGEGGRAYVITIIIIIIKQGG